MNILEWARRKLSYNSLSWKFRLVSEDLRGLDFTRDLSAVGISNDPALSFGYSSSGNKYLSKVLKDLRISTADKIIDIGCGKGGAMRIMLKFPFSRVDGLEISDRLAVIARKNFRILRIPSKRCQMITMDASLFQDLDPYNYIYFFNPFPSSVMIKFMTNLLTSVGRMPRNVFILYNNPKCHDVIVDTGVFRKVGEYPSHSDMKLFVYSGHA